MPKTLAAIFLFALLLVGVLVQSAIAQGVVTQGAAVQNAPVAAPDGVLTPAPVPNREPGGSTPADRAGRIDGADRSAPFSGLPSTLTPGGGAASPATIGAPDRDLSPTPSLSR